MLKSVFLPVLIVVMSGVGTGVRFYRTIFLEEVNRDYVRTARAKGLSEGLVLFKHALKNPMIPILTNVVLAIPFLFMGSLVMEAFFAIPELSSFTIEAINAQDFAIVRSMVYLGSILYIVASDRHQLHLGRSAHSVGVRNCGEGRRDYRCGVVECAAIYHLSPELILQPLGNCTPTTQSRIHSRADLTHR